MLKSSDLRIGAALAASIAIHALLLGLAGGAKQPHPFPPALEKVSFRLVARQAAPPKQEAVPVRPPAAQAAAPAAPPPVKTVGKAAPERVAKATPPPAKAGREETAPAARPAERQDRVAEAQATTGQTVAASPVTAPSPLPAPAVGTVEGEAEPLVMAKPHYRHNPPPSYPEKAKRRHQQGTVILEVEVSAAGEVEQVRLQESSGHRLLDQAAMAAVRQWRFEPGQRNGRPVAMAVLVPVRFALE